METYIILKILIFISFVTALAWILGKYMSDVFMGKSTIFSKFLKPIETSLYRLFGINENSEMDWKLYLKNLLIFNIITIIFLFLLQQLQSLLPLNPQTFLSTKSHTALNTAISFGTNTDWQSYSPESTLTYFTQMFGLTVQNFLSAAIGISAAIVFIRGFIKRESASLGNFWVDITRAILYILLPLSILFSIILISQGVIQNFNPYIQAHTLEGEDILIAQGPAASQVSIKLLGTNGGGFFNTNSAHPYENPTPFTNYLQILILLLIPAALPITFGIMVNNPKQGWILYLSMMLLFLLGLFGMLWFECQGNPILAKLGIENGTNLEGKELRNGLFPSILFAESTTATSCGAINSMHDSFLPLSGLILLFNMMIGEVIFGGVGTGLIGILAYSILTMFLIGLMIGRTPEIFGKKLAAYEMIMAILILFIPSILQLILSSIAISTPSGLSSLGNPEAHGLSEIIYAFASTSGNNGSAFAGLNSDTFFYNLMTAFAMLIGRFSTIIPALAIAGSLATKKQIPEEVQFPTANLLFLSMLIGVIIIIGALSFFPVLTMGPLIEFLSIK